jgi:potassium voltage-gated channel Eag-related subfamily H protein 8
LHNSLDFTPENNECYSEPFTYDEMLQSLEKSHNTAVGPERIHYQLIKHLHGPAKECLLLFLTLSGKVAIRHLPGHWLQLSLSLNKERITRDPNNYRPIALTSCVCKTM